MADTDELYVSVHPATYKKGKSEVLTCQSLTLISMKRLHKLKVLARQRNDLKNDLKRLFSSIHNDIDSIQDSMPTSSIPRSVRKVADPIKRPRVVDDTPKITQISKTDDLEEELKKINEKLRELNS